MSLASHRIILGNALTLDIPSGHELRADRVVNGATSTSTVTASDDGAEFRPTELGRYYLATREDATSDWCPAGLLAVVNLANDDYERLCAELDTVNGLLANAGNINSFIQYEVTTPDGTSVEADDRADAAQAPRRPRGPEGELRAPVQRAHAGEVQLSRVARALKALVTPDAAMSTVVTSPRNRGDVGPYQNPNRDQPISATRAPPGARQQWQLYRVREASRDLQLRSPIWGGYVHFIRVQCVGPDLARLLFDRLTTEQKGRLAGVTKYLRQEWNRYQMIRGVGGTGRSIHQMAGAALHHVDVDGDCFLTNRMVAGRRVWDLHPGDALAEGQYRVAGNSGNRQLGVETDGYGKPVVYYFRHGGRLAPLNVEYSTFGGQGGEATAFPANVVQHIRDLSGEATSVRGWPRCTSVIEYIARLDEWFAALVRSASMRASIGIALKKMEGMGAADVFGTPDDMGAEAPEFDADRVQERLPRYQEFLRNAGTVLEMDAGWEVQNIQSPAPSAQEAIAMEMLMQIVASSLRVSPATLFGNYKAISFSAGQLAALVERQTIEDRQMILAQQFYAPIYKDWFSARWMSLVGMFREIEPTDMQALLYPTVGMRKYQVLDKGRLVKPVLEAWAQGLMTYPEMRAELGYPSANVDDVIEQWKEDRRKLGLPETPDSGSMGGPPPGADGDDKDDDADEDDDDADG